MKIVVSISILLFSHNFFFFLFFLFFLKYCAIRVLNLIICIMCHEVVGTLKVRWVSLEILFLIY